MDNPNPNNNTILQALLDLESNGMGTVTITDAITKLQSDHKLQADLQAQWNKHAYPKTSLVYTQVGIEQAVFSLSGSAYMISGLMGMYASTSGCIQIRNADICKIIKLSRNTVRDAISELTDCGAIMIEVPAIHHAAPIYRVNPALFHKGAHRNASMSDFVKSLTIDPENYILSRKFDLIIQTDTVRTETLTYNKFYLETPEIAESKRKPKKSQSRKSKKTSPMPGQMMIADFPEFLPEGFLPEPED